MPGPEQARRTFPQFSAETVSPKPHQSAVECEPLPLVVKKLHAARWRCQREAASARCIQRRGVRLLQQRAQQTKLLIFCHISMWLVPGLYLFIQDLPSARLPPGHCLPLLAEAWAPLPDCWRLR